MPTPKNGFQILSDPKKHVFKKNALFLCTSASVIPLYILRIIFQISIHLLSNSYEGNYVPSYPSKI